MGELALRSPSAWALGAALLLAGGTFGCAEDSPTDTTDGSVPNDAGENDAGGNDAGGNDGGGNDGGGNAPVTYEQVAAILQAPSCATGGCHGPGGQAQLTLAGQSDLRTVLVDVPACTNNAMPRVDPGNPDNSWLLVKLGGHSTIGVDGGGRIDLAGPAPADDRAGCPLPANSPVAPFGERMPPPALSPNGLSAEQVDVVRRWITQGAPGPS